jgi:hemoglobin
MESLTLFIVLLVLIALYFIYVSFAKEHPESLYDRLGGIYSIAAVIDHFSDAVIKNKIAGKDSSNPYLKKWYSDKINTRLPGLKWMRTLWVCEQTGGPYRYIPTIRGACPMSLENAHKNLKITPEEFDAVAQELSKSLDHFLVPAKEKAEVLNIFSKHKGEINQGYVASEGMESPVSQCPFKF